MNIIIGSTNKVKLEAVTELLLEYPQFAEAKVSGINVTSEISDQPKSLEETVRGAQNRARNAFAGSDLSIGLESGLMDVPYTKVGFMDVCVCAIFDGTDFHIGLSSAFEPPKEMARLMVEKGLDMAQACNEMGLTDNPAIGAAEGAIGILTRGRMDRKAYTKQSLITALIHLENTHLFSR